MTTMQTRHRHEFTALWWNFGPFGRQDVHVHSCFRSSACGADEDCWRVLIGPGRDCDSNEPHWRETLVAE